MKEFFNLNRRRLGWGFLIMGLALMTPYLTHYATYRWEQHRLQEAWQQTPAGSGFTFLALHSSLQKPASPADVRSQEISPKRNTTESIPVRYPAPIVGRLSIPRMGLDDIILDGTSLDILKYGPGHLPGSSYPGHQGNTVIAAHNDLEFHTLGQLQAGDPVYVTDPNGKVYQFKVEKSQVIGPKDVIALNTPVPTLTLSTCYPFNAFKETPYRYIVTARLVA